MEKKQSIASQLEPKLKPLYQDLIDNVAHLDGEKCAFAMQWGKHYSLEVPRIVFVGRATNEWHGTEKDVKKLFGDPENKETIFNCYDQMTWVARDAQSSVYATNSSAFWRVIRAVSRNYFPDDELNYVAWSNVCKIQYVDGKNPSGPLYDAQIETCKKIFKAEMDVLKPDFVIMFIGEFGKTDILSYMNGGKMPECIEIKKWDCYLAEVYKIGYTTYICTEHPMRKKEGEHIKCLISLIDKYNKRIMNIDKLISERFELNKYKDTKERIKAIQDKIDDMQKLIISMYSYKARLRQQVFANWQKEVKDKFPDLECGMRGDYADVRFHLDGKNFYVNINEDEGGLFCQVVSEDESSIKDTRIMELEDLLPEHQANVSCDLWKYFRNDDYDQVFDLFCKVVVRCKNLMIQE